MQKETDYHYKTDKPKPFNNYDEYIDYRNAYWELLVEEGYDEYEENCM